MLDWVPQWVSLKKLLTFLFQSIARSRTQLKGAGVKFDGLIREAPAFSRILSGYPKIGTGWVLPLSVATYWLTRGIDYFRKWCRIFFPIEIFSYYIYIYTIPLWGFPDNSAYEESACNAGDPHSIPGLGRSTGEGIGYSFQYSWASLVAQLVKNPRAVWETWVLFLGLEDPLEERLPTPVFWPGEFYGLYSQWGHRVRHDWATFTFIPS